MFRGALVRLALVLGCALPGPQAAVHAQVEAKPASAASGVQAAPASGRAALPADLPLRRDADGPSMGSMGYVTWLLVVAAGFALVWAMRSQRGGGLGWLKPRAREHQTTLSVLAAKPVGPGCSLQVVRWGDKEFLLGCTPQSIQVVDSRVLPDPAAQEAM